MLDNCDKSAIHLFFNQPMATDNKRAATLMASNGRVMEKAVHHQDQQPLKCPRCDSANTKFCYYNNYSLSQPRHFCKACKRYWTRGGTLRNVPVGGGYRKNKKVKKSGGSSDGSSSLSSSLSHHQIDSPSSTSHINQLLYGLPNNNPSSFTNFPFQRFNSRGSNHSTETLAQQGYGALGLNFPSSSSMTRDDQHDFSGAVAGAGFNNHNHNNQIQDLLTSSNSILSNLSLLGSSTSSYATNASLIASTLQKQKQVWNGFNLKESRPNGVSNNFQGLLPFENLQMGGVVGNSDASMVMDMVKMEQGKWRVPYENHHLEQNGNSDALYWNSTTTNNVVGAAGWPDLANYGSSVTPLI